MADSYNKKERQKKKQKRRKEKAERKEQRKLEENKTPEFMYVDEFGNLTATPPDPTKKKAEVKLEDIDISVPSQEKSSESSFIRTGVVKFFNTEKGYGFIIDDETQESYFVHVNSLTEEIKERDKVSFEIGSGPKGPVANEVKIINDTKEG